MLLLQAAATLLVASLGDCKLTSGMTLGDCRVTYRTYGTLNADRSNVVLFPTWFNGRSEDLEPLIGPGKIVDSSKYYVVVLDSLGNGHSSSPSNDPLRKGNTFPRISISDMVHSQYRVVTEHLKLRHAHAVIGISMGGMQVYEWAAAYPDFIDKAVSIVGTPRMSERDMELWAKQFPLGRPRPAANPTPEPAGGRPDALSRILGQLGQVLPMIDKYRNPFNPLKQFEAVSTHDIGRNRGGLEGAARRIRARFLAVVASKDQALSPQTPLDFAKLTRSETYILDGSCGHNAFRCQLDELSAVIAQFLDGGR